MPSYTFDVTDKSIKFVYEVIKDMPGNPGQEVLVERLYTDAYGKVTVTVTVDEEEGVDIQSQGELHWPSNHPEAIEVIIKTAEDNSELIVDQASVPGPYALADAIASGDWKIVGYDS